MSYSTKQREAQAREAYSVYCKLGIHRNLWDVYNNYSYKKSRAWDYCSDLCAQNDGWGLKVITYNTFIFTAGFYFTDKDTGVLRFMYITPSHDTPIDC